MFTGLIEEVGSVRSVRTHAGGARLEIEVCWRDGEIPSPGDSVAVNGACLTVLDPGEDGFAADLSPETTRRTLLGAAAPGTPVNLERALRLGDRLGGHLVQGHVDGIVRVLAVQRQGGFTRIRVELPPERSAELAEKGSVALDGVSLTVARLGAGWFEVAVIPETLRATTLGRWRGGERAHLETDILAKYVARRLERRTTALEEVFGGGDA